MAVEPLLRQVQHLNNEAAARKRGNPGPPTLSTKREVHHDLEALIWVLVYAMMVHSYNSSTRETDKKEYSVVLDDHFGHGSAKTILEKRKAMLYSAQSLVGLEQISQWFPNPRERRFFIRCMTLIAKHDKGGEEEDCGTFEGGLNRDNPLWDSADDEDDYSHDEDADDVSGTYKATKAVQKSGDLLKRQPVITYESVAAILKKSIDELK